MRCIRTGRKKSAFARLAPAPTEWDAKPAERGRGMSKRVFRVFTVRVCDRAKHDGVLLDDGSILRSAIQPIALAVAAEMRADGVLQAP